MVREIADEELLRGAPVKDGSVGVGGLGELLVDGIVR